MADIVGLCSRSVYLITYSHPDKAKAAGRREFSKIAIVIFSKNG